MRLNAGLLLLDTNSPVTWTKERHVNMRQHWHWLTVRYKAFSTPAFRTALIKTGIATNRLAMP
ncbi:MAG: hypothetical protein V9H26_27605 [Verrucomicrobiota bacterium]